LRTRTALRRTSAHARQENPVTYGSGEVRLKPPTSGLGQLGMADGTGRGRYRSRHGRSHQDKADGFYGGHDKSSQYCVNKVLITANSEIARILLTFINR
jgi:hypothetical protein